MQRGDYILVGIESLWEDVEVGVTPLKSPNELYAVTLGCINDKSDMTLVCLFRTYGIP
jgi:hypothetical protein